MHLDLSSSRHFLLFMPWPTATKLLPLQGRARNLHGKQEKNLWGHPSTWSPQPSPISGGCPWSFANTEMCCVSMTKIAHPPVSMMHRMKCSPRKGNLWGSFHLHMTAAYQTGHIWRQALQPAPVLPSTCDWQWIKGPRSQNCLLYHFFATV